MTPQFTAKHPASSTTKNIETKIKNYLFCLNLYIKNPLYSTNAVLQGELLNILK